MAYFSDSVGVGVLAVSVPLFFLSFFVFRKFAEECMQQLVDLRIDMPGKMKSRALGTLLERLDLSHFRVGHGPYTNT